jgi:hypothetical protein
LRWTGLDENVADAIINALYKLVFEMAADPRHPLRLRFDEADWSDVERLQTDPEMQARVAQMEGGDRRQSGDAALDRRIVGAGRAACCGRCAIRNA